MSDEQPDVEAVIYEFLVSEGYHGNYLAAEEQASKLAQALAPVLAAAVREAEVRARETAVAQREAFLSSPGLDPAWIAGWHSATDHIAAALRPGDAPEGDTESFRAEDAPVGWDAPTMTSANCRCPDDCDCDGRFACDATTPPPTAHVCELVVGHAGMHRSGAHHWNRGSRAENAPEGGAS